MMRHRCRFSAVLLLAALACDASAPAETGQEPTAGEALETTTDQGPVKATVSITPKQPRLGDVITLSLAVEHEAGVKVTLPPFGEALGRFTVLKFVPRRSRSAAGAITETQSYSLQPPGSGKQRIPALRVEYQLAGEDDVRELLTDELTLQVESVAQGAEVSRELSPVPDKLDPNPGLPWWFWPAVGLGLSPMLLLLVAYGRSIKRKARRRTELGAYDAALRRLLALKDQPLPDQETADGWYVELSGIVRRYLEDRLRIRAPELTTEEFLARARRSAALEVSVRDGLSKFLAACDQVKFAAHRPEQDESGKTLELAEVLLTGQEEFLRRGEETAGGAR